MQKLNGSEKQIKWANDILDRIQNAANAYKTNWTAKLQKRIEKQTAKGKIEIAEKLQKRLNDLLSETDQAISWLPKITEASKVINLELAADDAEKTSANWYRLEGDFALMSGTRL